MRRGELSESIDSRKPGVHKCVKGSYMHESFALLRIAVSMLTRSRVGLPSGEVRILEGASGLEHPPSDRGSGDLYLFCVVGFREQGGPSPPIGGFLLPRL